MQNATASLIMRLLQKLKKCNVTTLITVGKLIDVLIDQQEMIKKAELD